MWLIGQVIDVQIGIEGDRSSDADLATLYLEAEGDITAVVCYTGHLPKDVLWKCIRIDARFSEIRAVQERDAKLKILLRAAPYYDCIRVLSQPTLRRLEFRPPIEF